MKKLVLTIAAVAAACAVAFTARGRRAVEPPEGPAGSWEPADQ